MVLTATKGLSGFDDFGRLVGMEERHMVMARDSERTVGFAFRGELSREVSNI